MYGWRHLGQHALQRRDVDGLHEIMLEACRLGQDPVMCLFQGLFGLPPDRDIGIRAESADDLSIPVTDGNRARQVPAIFAIDLRAQQVVGMEDRSQFWPMVAPIGTPANS